LFDTPKEVYDLLNNNQYICNNDIALCVYLAYKINKPVLIQGMPGVGKSQLAKTVSTICSRRKA